MWGYVLGWKLTFRVNIYGPLDGEMVILRLCSLPLEVFTQRNSVSDFIRLKLSFILENNKSLFEPALGGLRGNVRTSFIACCKGRGRFPICHNWTFIGISYSWDVISGNLSKSSFFEGGGSLRARISGERASPTNHCWCQKTRVIALGVVS